MSASEVNQKLGLSNIKIYEIPIFNASLVRIAKSPFTEIPKHKKHILQLSDFIDEKLPESIHLKELWIGTEKDLFTQILMRNLSSHKNKIKVIAFEEGLGFYSENNWKDYLLKWIYPLITPILFGVKYGYYKRLGTHPMISEVYARFPEELPSKKTNVVYHKIKTEAIVSNAVPNKTILFFTAPLSEGSICSKEEEQILFKKIFARLEKAGFSIDIKAHPREDINKFKHFASQNIQVLDHKLSGENLDYFQYKFLMNLGSSIILDIHQRNFPLERVITLNMEQNFQKFTNKLFERGTHFQLFGPKLEENLTEIIKTIEDAR